MHLKYHDIVNKICYVFALGQSKNLTQKLYTIMHMLSLYVEWQIAKVLWYECLKCGLVKNQKISKMSKFGLSQKKFFGLKNNKYFEMFLFRRKMCQLIAWSLRNDIFTIRTLIGKTFVVYSIRFLIHFYHEMASCITTAKNGLVYVTLNFIVIHTCVYALYEEEWPRKFGTLHLKLKVGEHLICYSTFLNE